MTSVQLETEHRIRREVAETEQPARPFADRLLGLGVGRPVLDLAVFGLAYGAIQETSLRFLSDFGIAAVWPPAGLAVAVLLLTDRRRWPWLLAGLAIANVIGNVLHDRPTSLLAVFALANILEPLIGASLIRRIRPNAHRLREPADVMTVLLGAATLAPAIAAIVATTGICLDLGTFDPFLSIARGWYISDAVGVVVVAPLILAATSPYTSPVSARPIELAASTFAICAFTQLLFGPSTGPQRAIVGLPILVALFLWPGLRLGARAVTIDVALVAGVVIWHTSDGDGPFAPSTWTIDQQLGAVQLFVAQLVLVNLVIASMVGAQREALQLARRSAEELDLRRRELERSNQDLSEFSYAVSHDLAAPLRAVGGFAELVKARYSEQLDAKAEAWIDNIVSGVDRMRRMISDVLAYSTASSSGIVERVDLDDAVESARRALAEEIARSGAEVSVVGSLPTIDAQRSQIERLLTNLISNSIKYRSADRRPVVTVSAGVDPSGRRWLTVADNGIGIAPEHRQLVFRMFHRLDNSDGHPGTGIGLAVAKRVVEQWDGAIEVVDVPGPGCAIRVYLPADARKDPSHALPASGTVPS